jgi:hypothetical protein
VKRARQEATGPRPSTQRAEPAGPPGQPERPGARVEAGGRAAAAAPRAAIVIDDLGQRLSHFEQLAALDIPLTIAVIPGLPATEATVREAARRGVEMILHQPMEPREEGRKNPGAGVLLTAMGAEEVRGRLRESLAAVPGAIGVNNHMGSRFTEDPGALTAVMAELRERGLFWLDSRTTSATRGAAVARSAGVPAIERDVFLDARVSADFTRRQVRLLIARARTRGSAVGIGHPHPETIAVLRELRGELLGSGVALVPLSALVPAAPAAAPGAALAAADRTARGGADRGAAKASP